MIDLKIKQLHPGATFPTYATKGSACFDLSACLAESPVVIAPGTSASIGTGLSVEIPCGYRMDVFSRSGHGFKSGVSLVNGTGKIDSDYRGEVLVGLRNDGTKDFVVNHGDRIAQAEINVVNRVNFLVVNELSSTVRGTGGIGSTGV